MDETPSSTEAELAGRARVGIDRIRRLVAAGVLRPDADGAFPPGAVGLVGLVEELERDGVALEDMARAVAAGVLSLAGVQSLVPIPVQVRTITHRQLAVEIGVPFEVIEHLYRLWGVAVPDADAPVREDDEHIIRVGAQVYEMLGRDEAALSAATRYFGENIRRMAESQVEFFREIVLEPAFASGQPPGAVLEMAGAASAVLRPAAEELIKWLHARHFEGYLLQNAVLATETAVEAAGFVRRPPPLPPAIAFMDLSGYTRLTEEAGDAAAAHLASSLADLVGDTSLRHRGRAVKLLGDGVMFHFPDPSDAVRCGLDLVERTEDLGLPPGSGGGERGSGGVPGRRLLRRDGERGGPDPRLRPTERGAGHGDGGGSGPGGRSSIRQPWRGWSEGGGPAGGAPSGQTSGRRQGG